MKPKTTHHSALVGLACVFATLLALHSEPVAADDDLTRVDGVIAGTAYSLLVPDDWNGDLVVLVHGSIAETFEALAPSLAARGFGVAFATLGPGKDGAALKLITLHTRQVQALFTARFGDPRRTYLMGFSRGGHNMANLLETTPDRYDGMLAICAGNGGSQLQWDHFFTARVLFDYHFPGVLPGTALRVPSISLSEFLTVLAPQIINAILADPTAAVEMAAVNQYDLAYEDFGELVVGIMQSLALHTIGVNELLEAANGNPFDNLDVGYTGTSDDARLNAGIARLRADPAARNYLSAWYEPEGTTNQTPVLLLHTSRDPIVPEVANNDRYQALVEGAGNGNALVRRVLDRFGHCTIGMEEIATGFEDLVNWVDSGLKPAP